MSKGTRVGIVTLCLVVALLAGVASGLGVFARGDGSTARFASVRGEHYDYVTTGIYRYNAERVVAEGVGWDWVTLFLVVPAMLLTLPAVARGSLRGRLVAAGLLGYFFYQYLMYAMTWAFGPLFVVFVAIYGGSIAGVVWIASTTRSAELAAEFDERFPAKGVAVYTILMGAALALMWAQRISLTYKGDLSALYGLPTLVVQALDLGIIVPLAVFVGVASLLRKPIAYLLAPIFMVKAFGMSAGITAMLISAAMVEGALEVPPFVMFGAATLAAAWLCVLTLRRAKATPLVTAEGRAA